MEQSELNKILENHKKWLNNKGGERADLREADLREADLRWADLRGANIDFSSCPLWCGSKDVKVDNRIVFQLAAHICVLDCDTPEFKAIKDLLLPYAKQCRRAQELGLTGQE
jgi:hypothetical protein